MRYFLKTTIEEIKQANEEIENNYDLSHTDSLPYFLKPLFKNGQVIGFESITYNQYKRG